MEIQHLLGHIKYLMSLSADCTFETNLAHAVEELGEVAKASRDLRYATNKLNGDDPVSEARFVLAEAHLQEEAVDLCVTAFAVYLATGGKVEDFYQTFMRKCGKWETNAKKK